MPKKRGKSFLSFFQNMICYVQQQEKGGEEEEFFTSEETLPDAGTVGGNIRWNYPGNIIPTEKNSAGKGNILTELLCQSKGI